MDLTESNRKDKVMSHIIIPPGWNEHERSITPESVFQNRREFLKLMGFAGLAIGGSLAPRPAWAETGWMERLFGGTDGTAKMEFRKIEGLRRNPAYPFERPMTVESVALKYNNFYEFTSVKEGVWKLVDEFKPRPWQVEVSGLVKNPKTYDVDALMKLMPLEERVYRHRCVETWAMVVPWNGFPLSELLRRAEPTAQARYVRFTSFLDPEVAPGQKRSHLPWPYTEGLTIEEAMNELTFMATGVYGHVLPNQHGAPLRVVTPWKYGYKSIKSVVKIELVANKPATFWNTLVPHEYGFVSNVDPNVPHPRWSQARERMIGTGEVYPTVKYNGYGRWVASLYS